jgi:hypothetical protein
MIFSCVVPFKRKRKKNAGIIAATLYISKIGFPRMYLENTAILYGLVTGFLKIISEQALE